MSKWFIYEVLRYNGTPVFTGMREGEIEKGLHFNMHMREKAIEVLAKDIAEGNKPLVGIVAQDLTKEEASLYMQKRMN